MTPRRYVVLVLVLGLLTGLEPLSIDMTLPAVAAMAGGLAAGHGEIQFGLSAFVTGMAVGQVAYGPLSDRFGRKPVLLAGLGAFVLLSAAAAGAADAAQLAGLRFLQGAAAAAGQTLVRAIVRDHYQRDEAARLLSFVMVVLAAAPIAAPFLGAWISGSLGWRALFWFFALYGLLNVACVALFYQESVPAKDPAALRPGPLLDRFRALLASPDFRLYAACSLSAFCGLFAFLAGVPVALVGGLGLGPAAFSLCFAAVMAPQALVLLASGFLVGRVGMDRMLGCGLAAAAAAGAAMLAWTSLDGLSVAAVVVPAALFMAAFALIVPNAIAGAITPFPDISGAASSLVGFLQFGAASLVSALVSLLADGSATPMAAAICASGALGLLALRGLRRRG